MVNEEDNVISPKIVDERRKNPRIENNIPVKICQEDGDFVTETKNISRSGAYCRVSQYIAPMTKMKIHLLLSVPQKGKNVIKKISCEGVVVRSEPLPDGENFHIAIFFSDITQRDAESIMDYVDMYLKKEDIL